MTGAGRVLSLAARIIRIGLCLPACFNRTIRKMHEVPDFSKAIPSPFLLIFLAISSRELKRLPCAIKQDGRKSLRFRTEHACPFP